MNDRTFIDTNTEQNIPALDNAFAFIDGTKFAGHVDDCIGYQRKWLKVAVRWSSPLPPVS